MNNIGKSLIIIGLVIAFSGVVIMVLSRFKIPVGRFPGDIFIQKKNFTFYFPLTTSIVLSIILSLILYFLSRK